MPQALLYAFPPFSLLPSVVHQVQTKEAKLVLVAPHALSDPAPPGWNAQGAPSLGDLLSQGSRSLLHPFPGEVRLTAWPLRGRGSMP